MSTSKVIRHTGKVIDITDKVISVEFVNKSACADCHAKSVCMASDEKIKVVEVKNTQFYGIEVGETVTILLSEQLGFRAVALIYVVPLVTLMILLLSLSNFFPDKSSADLYTGLFSLGFLALYFIMIYLFRGKIGKDFVFTIEKIVG